jgi:glucose/arabinose dehydrogenase
MKHEEPFSHKPISASGKHKCFPASDLQTPPPKSDEICVAASVAMRMSCREREIMVLITAPLTFLLAACGDSARLPEGAGYGPNPTLPPPNATLIPTVNIAPAKGWPEGGKPTAARGLSVDALATGLDHPRWLYVLPNVDVLVAETNARERPKRSGPKTWILSQVQKRAGAGVPSANRITLLRDADGDGVAETRSVFLQGLNSPFGMVLVGNQLYVANTCRVAGSAGNAGRNNGNNRKQLVQHPQGRIVRLRRSPDGAKDNLASFM